MLLPGSRQWQRQKYQWKQNLLPKIKVQYTNPPWYKYCPSSAPPLCAVIISVGNGDTITEGKTGKYFAVLIAGVKRNVNNNSIVPVFSSKKNAHGNGRDQKQINPGRNKKQGVDVGKAII